MPSKQTITRHPQCKPEPGEQPARQAITLQDKLRLLLISMSVFLCVLDLFIVNVAIPQIRQSMGGSTAESQFIIVLYVTGYGAFLVTGGKLGTRYGHKKIFQLALLAFMLCSLCCGLAQTPLQLNTGRLLQGISAAFMVPQGVALISGIFIQEAARSKALGIYGAIAGIASVLGQVLGGVLPALPLDFGAWRLIFLINIPIALGTVLAAAKLLPVIPARIQEPVQVRAQLVLIVLLVVFICQVVLAGEKGWTPVTALLISSTLAGLVLFIYRQYKQYRSGRNVLLNGAPFKYRSFRLAIAAAATYNLVQDAYFFINANYFQQGLRLGPAQTGMLFAFQGMGYVLASLCAVRYLYRYQERFMVSGLFLMIVCLLLHILFLNDGVVSPVTVAAILFFYGLGCGIVLPSMFTHAMHQLPAGVTPVASGIYLTAQQISIALGVSLLGRIYFQSGNGYYSATGAMIALLGITALIFCMGLYGAGRKRHTGTGVEAPDQNPCQV
ncbi:MFS transporter [Taibaiella chishuiensis]|uniref:MFS transporter n=1 Tax=Taibaiella chishuiensis TaxID=1434707 RepID=A0A2P8D7G7_9BACT|nr:MFS transporter [Taibaiella chishuiensis]PSK93176.1 MFS transporter [Taibaiella chishuiensis]